MSRAAAAVTLLCGVLWCALGSGAAWAAPGAEVGIEDERLLLSENEEAPQVVRDWKASGVDVVRLHARWNAHAPAVARRVRPRGFRPSDPADRRYDWSRLDNAIRLVREHGMRVMLTVTGPGPLWSSRRPRLGNARYMPDPAQFAAYATAIARRYGTGVDRYLIWNEPNQGGWLEPQWSCRGAGRRTRCSTVAPHLYRGLVRAAGPAIERADPGAQILIGELAPIGRRGTSSRTPIAPLPFLRSFGCVNGRYRPVRTGRCRGFRPAAGDAVGHHPHPVRLAPDESNPDRNSAQLADTGRLIRVLDRLVAARRIRTPGGRRLDVHLTEFGYQTSPPDHAIGISLAKQVRYEQQAIYFAWKHPRIRGLTHYQWRDEPVFDRGPGRFAYAGWQSGLRYIDDRPKPVMKAWLQPFVIDGRRLWGQVKPGGGAGEPVRIQRLAGGTWRTIASARTGAHGYWTKRLSTRRGARYRFAWGQDADLAYGGPERRTSGVLRVAGGTARVQAASIPR